MTDVACEAFDVGLLDRVIRYRSWEREGENGHVTTRNQTKQEELPEDLMAALADHIGDAMAKVTVGAELGHSKEYGCKAQAFVSISVHCNNDDDTIDAVQGLLHDKARGFVKADLEDMIVDRDEYLVRDRQQPEALPPGRQIRGADATKPPPRAKPQGNGKPRAKPRTRPNYQR